MALGDFNFKQEMKHCKTHQVLSGRELNWNLLV